MVAGAMLLLFGSVLAPVACSATWNCPAHGCGTLPQTYCSDAFIASVGTLLTGLTLVLAFAVVRARRRGDAAARTRNDGPF
ncbi:MAG: hypothetical protein ACREDK_04520 [Thermoplasmata archaeon]